MPPPICLVVPDVQRHKDNRGAVIEADRRSGGLRDSDGIKLLACLRLNEPVQLLELEPRMRQEPLGIDRFLPSI